MLFYSVDNALKEFNDQRFSGIVFGKGVFWEQEDFYNELNEDDTPFHRLLNYLMAAREYLIINKKELPTTTIDKLLITCILIKFLEDIRDDKNKHTLRNIYKKFKVKNLSESLLKGNLILILDELTKEFNGSVFDNFSDQEKQQLKQTDLEVIANFLTAKLDIAKEQYFLWEQYSFNHLPVELISSIYERFLPRKKGVIYTPPFLVNFLIDEVMPLNDCSLENYFNKDLLRYKILGPSCGSGVFLVDVLEYYIHLGKGISEKGEGYKLHTKVSEEQLKNFGKVFCDVINPIHEENGMSWQIGDVYQTTEKTFIIYQFIFGPKNKSKNFKITHLPVDDLDKNLSNIIYNNKDNIAATFTRVTRIYGSQNNYDYLILIKPIATRYWLNSIAIRDADETILDYYEAGY
ncbi:MAG: hypothetical protein H7A23_01785 [Leptospiraceae bacterium]|nr:hypothetical protein [Leptospiraceae bacterium]MCP5493263.1 hypothetical protein [Leptospiraceae bacterium]